MKENKNYQVGDEVEIRTVTNGQWVPAVILEINTHGFPSGSYRGMTAKVFIKKEYLELWENEFQTVGFYNIR